MFMVASFLKPKKESRRIHAEDPVVVIGRDDRAQIRLGHPSISREHALVTLIEGKSHFYIEDKGSANGTFVDGVRIDKRQPLHPDQQVQIGPYYFSLCIMKEYTGSDGMTQETMSAEKEKEDQIVLEAVRTLPDIMGSAQLSEDKDQKALARKAEVALYRKIVEMLPDHLKTSRAEPLTKAALTLSFGLGPLEGWLKDSSISEIMINGTESVYIEKDGILEKIAAPFPSEASIMRIVDRVLSPLGRRVDEKCPYVDGRLPDGSRINVTIPPVCLNGPVLTIRKFSADRLNMSRLVAKGSLTQDAAAFLKTAVTRKRSILISGGTGTGKTTLLNSLASFISPSERVITIEDAAELDLGLEHVVSLETRPPSIEGENAITIRDLVRNSLRMRPDRIIVGECRGAEALDMLQAMNTGHEGSMTTCHANTTRDALKRLEMMSLMAGVDLPTRVIREQIASAINIILQLSRLPGGKRAVTSIVEVVGVEVDQILSQPIFEYCKEKAALKKTGLQSFFLADCENLREMSVNRTPERS